MNRPVDEADAAHFTEILRRRLQIHSPPPVAPSGFRPASVLVPILRHDGVWQLLLTQRTHEVPDHPGQVAFPGGKSDPGDRDVIQTALRESEEEIGLDPAAVELLGLMTPRLTITDYWLTPVVGLIPWPFEMRLSERELSRAFCVPLPWLADPANRKVEYLHHPRKGANTPVWFFPWPGHTIWGATARIVKELVDILADEDGPAAAGRRTDG
jgi:8-oxo-dGTP pyrophosphatase MutT (NUDIX family)